MANRSIICYVSPKKIRGYRVAAKFVASRRGKIMQDVVFRSGEIAFWGMNDFLAPLWPRRHAAPKFYYLDHAYLGRGQYYRATVNDEQIGAGGVIGFGDDKRLERLGVTIEPWRKDGRNILVCPPGAEFMRCRGLSSRKWFNNAARLIRFYSDRQIVVREKPARGVAAKPLAVALRDVFAVVAYASNVAVEAALAGIPVFVDGPSAARPIAGTDFSKIEKPIYHDCRREWAAWLAANQWTLEEFRRGKQFGFWKSHGLG